MKNKKIREWQKAEQVVARLLTELLTDGCLVVNDIKFKYGNIDHLVIRPDGFVFNIETKAHRGVVTTDGKQLLLNGKPFKKNYFCQMNRTIRWERRIMQQLWGKNTWMIAVIVFPNADVRINKSIKRINVISADKLLSFIRSYSNPKR